MAQKPGYDAALMGSKGRPYKPLELEGFEVLIGRGDADNDRLTFGVAGPRDFWLHVSGASGSHVVVRNPANLDALPRSVLERVAELAVWHSKAREAHGKIEVHVCQVRDVRKPPGFEPGKVLLRRFDAVRVYSKPPSNVDTSRARRRPSRSAPPTSRPRRP
jgi:predicted ribosome quality control (RQC) complex YloA/Tae2 family protein